MVPPRDPLVQRRPGEIATWVHLRGDSVEEQHRNFVVTAAAGRRMTDRKLVSGPELGRDVGEANGAGGEAATGIAVEHERYAAQ